MKARLIKLCSILALFFALNLATVPQVQAQCPMCRIAAESNMKNGGTAGKGLNNGILYILATPYLLVGVIGFVWWRNRRYQRQCLWRNRNRAAKPR